MRNIRNIFSGIFLIFLQFSLNASVVVRINEGFIEGWETVSWSNISHHSFMGIPYAEAPKGNLRFQPPVKKGAWQGNLNAFNYGPMCMQPVNRGEESRLDEDCLTLNVFTRSVDNTTALKPVIVFIHGGAYEAGGSVNHWPNYLMDRDIVLVTINYRLGAFGFLAAGTEKAMGNMGLKDQVMALQWVQDNIRAFRGDPQRVTISGLSAGGFSVSALMASDMARNLFQRAILMSGSITWMSRLNRDYKELAQQLAKEVNCGNATDIVECLQGVPAQQIVAANVIPAVPCGTGVSMVWNPVIEGDFNQVKFFSRNPIEVFQDSPQTRFNNIQIMIGITEHEIIYAAPGKILNCIIIHNFASHKTLFFWFSYFIRYPNEESSEK
jgi:carboxylesterase type B